MKIQAWMATVVALTLLSRTPAVAQAETVESPAESQATGSPAEESPNSVNIRKSQDNPQLFQELLARTVERVPALTRVASQDKGFEALLPATLIKPIESVEGIHILTLDFGAGPGDFAECYVYQDALDMAGGLMSLSDHLFGVIEQTYGELEIKGIAGLDAAARGMVPTLSLSWIYRAKGNESTGGSVAGQTKHHIATKDGHSLYCHSTSPGFDAAFKGLFESLVDTATFSGGAEVDPYYRDISLVSVGTQVVGIARSFHRIDEDGDIERRESVSMLIPVDQSTLQVQDSETMEYSTLTGNLMAKIEVEASDGRLTTHLNLNQGEEGWAVSGTFEGKDLSADLGPKELRSDFGQRLDLLRFLETAEADAELKMSDWTAEMDPTTFQESRWTFRGRDDDRFKLDFALGPLSMSGVLDSQGTLLTVSIPVGATQFEIRRVAAEGNPMHPTTLATAEDSNESTEPEGPETGEGRGK